MRKTKIDLLKEHLLSGKSITQLEAIGLYSLFRLAARVHELKNAGWAIETEIKEDQNGSIYAEYSLLPKAKAAARHRNNPHGLPEFARPSRPTVFLPEEEGVSA